MVRLPTEPELTQVHPQAAGIDIGASEHWVSIPAELDPEPVRKFSCFTADLYAIAEWLTSRGITTVAMESTGVQLHRVVSDVTGVTGMAIIRAIIAGERDPQRLA
jgi:hypothetical protein